MRDADRDPDTSLVKAPTALPDAASRSPVGGMALTVTLLNRIKPSALIMSPQALRQMRLRAQLSRRDAFCAGSFAGTEVSASPKDENLTNVLREDLTPFTVELDERAGLRLGSKPVDADSLGTCDSVPSARRRLAMAPGSAAWHAISALQSDPRVASLDRLSSCSDTEAEVARNWSDFMRGRSLSLHERHAVIFSEPVR